MDCFTRVVTVRKIVPVLHTQNFVIYASRARNLFAVVYDALPQQLVFLN